MAGESFDVSGGAGEVAQEREYYLRKITYYFPERESDPSLVYGNPKLEYLRLVNEGLIPENTGNSNGIPEDGGGVAVVNFKNNVNAPRPNSPVVFWIGWSERPVNFGADDFWFETYEPPFDIRTSIPWTAAYLASDIEKEDGAIVDVWEDSSGNGLHLKRSNAAIGTGQAVLTKSSPLFNGKPGVNLSLSPLWSDLLTATKAQPYTVVAVARANQPSRIWSGSASTVNTGTLYRATSGSGHYMANAGGGAFEGQLSATNDPVSIMAVYNDMESKMYRSGTELSLKPVPIRGGIGKINRMILGGENEAAVASGVDIAFVGIYPGIFSDKQMDQINDWILKEYAL